MKPDSKVKQRIVKIGFNTFFLFGVVIFIASLFYKHKGEAYIGKYEDAIEHISGWTYKDKTDGTTQTLVLPARLQAEKGDEIIIHNTLPKNITTGMSLSYRAARQDVKIFIDGKLRESYCMDNMDINVGHLPSAYIFVDLYTKDASKDIDISIVPYDSGTTTLSVLNYSYGHDIWLQKINDNIFIAFEAAAMILIGIIIIIAFSILHRIIDVGYSFFYLAQMIIVFGLWELSETQLRQMFFSAPYFSTVFAFIFIELMAAYAILFVDELQEHYYKRIFSILEILILVQIVINTVLNFTGLVYYYDTLIYSHIWTAVSLITIFVTIILDVKNGRIKKYLTAAIGTVAVAVCAFAELILFYVSDRNLLGLSTGIGFTILVAATLIQTIKDIIELKHQNDKNEEAAHIANEANKAKSEFLALISHEIRTPLNAVIGMNELILSESSEKPVLEYAANACNAGKNLLSIINDILDISKMEAGKLEIVNEEYELYSLVSDCISLVTDRAKKKGLKLSYKVDETLPSKLYGDMFHIRQIIVNLLTNAVKYTEKGSVSMLVEGMNVNDKFTLYISVADTGIGLTEENRQNLFTSFQRFDLKKNRSIEGTGLGLSICKKLIDMMNGNIFVDSEYGKGSVFCVTIPQKIVDESPIGGMEKLASPLERERKQIIKFIAKDVRILIVDDVDMNILIFKNYLKEYGLIIDDVESGAKCLEIIQKHKYDLIFMDYMMPEMDGIETFRKMNELCDNLNNDTPVIMLTANAVGGMKEKYAKEGFSGYLSKPADKSKIVDVLLKFLPKEKITFIETNNDNTENTGDKKMEISELEGLKKVFPEADIEKGLKYCSDSKEFYIELLRDFAVPSKKDDVQKAYDEKSWSLYAVKIHAMKGSARTLGITEIEKITEGLQKAAEKIQEKGNDAEALNYIEENHDKAMTMFDRLVECIKGA